MRYLLAASIALLPACVAPRISVEPSYGSLSLDGDVRATSGASAVTSDNSLDALGLDDAEGVLLARADFAWLSPHLTVRATDVSFSGDGTLEAEVSEGGVVIPVGTAVSSDLEVALASALLTFDVAPTQALELGLGFGLAWIDFAAEVRDTAGGQSVEASEALPVPLLAARVAADVWRLRLEALASGLAVDTGDARASLLDLDLAARMKIFGPDGSLGGHLVLGWRLTSIEAESNDGSDEFEGSVDLSGPYLGLAFGF